MWIIKVRFAHILLFQQNCTHCNQGRSRPPRRPRAAGQLALRHNQPTPRAPLRLREGILHPRRHREPHQETVQRFVAQPHQLLPLLAQQTPGSDDRDRLRPDTGTATAHTVCARAQVT